MWYCRKTEHYIRWSNSQIPFCVINSNNITIQSLITTVLNCESSVIADFLNMLCITFNQH